MNDGDWRSGWRAGGLLGAARAGRGDRAAVDRPTPQPVYDFVVGMNRWVLRVAAYVSLVTDHYPPFPMDMGGTDPRTHPLLSSA